MKYKNKRTGMVVEPTSDIAAQTFTRNPEWVEVNSKGEAKGASAGKDGGAVKVDGAGKEGGAGKGAGEGDGKPGK